MPGRFAATTQQTGVFFGGKNRPGFPHGAFNLGAVGDGPRGESRIVGENFFPRRLPRGEIVNDEAGNCLGNFSAKGGGRSRINEHSARKKGRKQLL